MSDSRRRCHACSATLTGILLASLLAGCDDHAAPQAAPSPAETRAVVHPELWPTVTRPALDDSAIDRRLDALIKSLSVEEKVGQIIQPDVGTVTAEDVRKYRFGSVLNG